MRYASRAADKIFPYISLANAPAENKEIDRDEHGPVEPPVGSLAQLAGKTNRAGRFRTISPRIYTSLQQHVFTTAMTIAAESLECRHAAVFP
jgi:hypothetical protein